MADTTPSITASRRAILAGGLALPAFALALATPATAARGISRDLSLLIEAHANATAAADRFYAEVFIPADEAHDLALAAHRARIDAVPHIYEMGGLMNNGKPYVFTSEDGRSSRAMADAMVKDDLLAQGDPDRTATIAAGRRFIEADDKRNAVIAALGSPPEPTVSEDGIYDAVNAAFRLTARFPVTTIADLHAKLQWLQDNDGMGGDDLLPIITADVARIVGEA
jgi:hypothetical protein